MKSAWLVGGKMQQLIECMKSGFTEIDVSLTDENWNQSVPEKSGWYYFSTNTPVSVFKSLNTPPSTYKNKNGKVIPCMNYNLTEKANDNFQEINLNSIIITIPEFYAVYSGHAKDLKSRSKEHTFSHPGTAGLALSNYDKLKEFKWSFFYKPISDVSFNYSNDKLVRVAGEQVCRSLHGWPLLCSE